MKFIFVAIVVIIALLWIFLAYFAINLDAVGSVKRPLALFGPEKLCQQFNLTEYFPMELGLRWEYEITIGQEAPFVYSYLLDGFFSGKVIPLNAAKERTRVLVNTDTNRSFSLVISVADSMQINATTGNVGAEIFVHQDDLGVFNDVKKLFWVLDNSTYQPAIVQLAVYPLYELGNGVNLGNGIEYRTLLSQIPQGDIVIPFSSTDYLTFNGVENGMLHFMRYVAPLSGIGSFREHSFFAKGKGLVKMIQQDLNGRTMMTWKLQRVTMGPPVIKFPIPIEEEASQK